MSRWQSHSDRTIAFHVNWNGVLDREVAACDEVLLAQFHDEQPWVLM